MDWGGIPLTSDASSPSSEIPNTEMSHKVARNPELWVKGCKVCTTEYLAEATSKRND